MGTDALGAKKKKILLALPLGSQGKRNPYIPLSREGENWLKDIKDEAGQKPEEKQSRELREAKQLPSSALAPEQQRRTRSLTQRTMRMSVASISPRFRGAGSA